MCGTGLSFYLVLYTVKLSMVARIPRMGGEKVMRQTFSLEFGDCFCMHKCEFP